MTYKYTSEQHTSHLLTAMQQMIGNTMHCDVTLQCQEDAVQVPGLVLASISPLFKQLGILGRDTDFVMLPDFTVSFIGNHFPSLILISNYGSQPNLLLYFPHSDTFN